MKKKLYHIHRNGYMDDFWTIENEFTIDNSYIGLLFQEINESTEEIVKKSKYQDLDKFISEIKKEISKEKTNRLKLFRLNESLYNTYIIRREKALEEARKIYAPTAPPRANSLFVTNERNLEYWKNELGRVGTTTFKLRLDGDFFVTSDIYFPDSNLSTEEQIEQSKKYWQPKRKILLPRQEILFQGRGKIIE